MEQNSKYNIPYTVQLNFYRVVRKETSIREFENWIYSNKDLENLLKDYYYELITIDFDNNDIIEVIKKITFRFIDFKEIEKNELTKILDELVLLNDNFPKLLKIIYDLSCNEDFSILLELENITYSLAFEVGIYYDENWKCYSMTKRKEITSAFMDKINDEVLLVQKKINKENYSFTGELASQYKFPLLSSISHQEH